MGLTMPDDNCSKLTDHELRDAEILTDCRNSIHSAQEEFEDAAPSLRSGPPSTCTNLMSRRRSFSKSLFQPEEFESAALLLRLGLPLLLIRDKNERFRKRSSNRSNLKTMALRFRVRR